MIGIIYALIASISQGINQIFHKTIVNKEDALSYGFALNMLGAILFIPFAITHLEFPESKLAWALLLLSSLIWALVTYFSFLAYKYLDVGSKAPSAKAAKLIIVMILSVVILKEQITLLKSIGFILIILALVMVTYNHKLKIFEIKNKGVRYTFLSSSLAGVALLIDKYETAYFNTNMYAFLLYLLPALFLLPFLFNSKKEMKSLIKNKYGFLIGATLLSMSYYYFILLAFKTENASIVIPLIEASTFFAVIFSIIFLKERERIFQKILATIIVIIGAVLISLSA